MYYRLQVIFSNNVLLKYLPSYIRTNKVNITWKLFQVILTLFVCFVLSIKIKRVNVAHPDILSNLDLDLDRDYLM